jgi:hypothetical protein
MLFVECPYCHKKVFRLFFSGHCKRHTALRPDGQMTDHVTVHPKGRYTGSLKGVPQVYIHPRCGVGTKMPEEIVRSYLVNPFLYNDMTFCCGCNDYVNQKELVWHDTGERLNEYFRKLKAGYVAKHGERPPDASD